jgi:hypothetical protein
LLFQGAPHDPFVDVKGKLRDHWQNTLPDNLNSGLIDEAKLSPKTFASSINNLGTLFLNWILGFRPVFS